MRKPRVKGLSAKVRARREERRRQRRERVGEAMFIFAVWLVVVGVFYLFYVVRRPTWADFSTSDPFQEHHSGAWGDGVPVSLLVNGEDWSIVQVTSFDDAKNADGSAKAGSFPGDLAQTFCANRTIAYIPDGNPAELRVSLIHEVFHAGACLHGGDAWWNSEKPTRTRHDGIYHLGDFMAEFSLANPEFMKWMSEVQ